MQISEHIHALKIPFKLRVGPDKMLDRFVFVYLIFGDQICLIDSGVAGSESIILDYIKQTGRDPRDVTRLVFTHSHPDHIGGSRAIKEQTGCKVAAHIDASDSGRPRNAIVSPVLAIGGFQTQPQFGPACD